jgi:F-type H+-transporting ATPase subunit a
MEHELWVTALFNRYLGPVTSSVLGMLGVHPEDPARPWTNFASIEVVVALLIIVLLTMLRPRLSVDQPGKLQHIFEMVYEFLRGQIDDIIGHHGRPHVSFFGTVFIFILFMNLIGLVPTFESPTMFPAVPLGCALAAFVYYNLVGVRSQGLFHYLKHFAGPNPWLAPLLFPIELISNLARPLSLTIRLYANMFAGEQVTLAFMGLIPLVLPLPFMGLHLFVAFLQAYIFTLLTMVYVGGALPAPEGH